MSCELAHCSCQTAASSAWRDAGTACGLYSAASASGECRDTALRWPARLSPVPQATSCNPQLEPCSSAAMRASSSCSDALSPCQTVTAAACLARLASQSASAASSSANTGRGATSAGQRSEEHTSELQSLMRISYAVFCLKKTRHITTTTHISKPTINS